MDHHRPPDLQPALNRPLPGNQSLRGDESDPCSRCFPDNSIHRRRASFAAFSAVIFMQTQELSRQDMALVLHYYLPSSSPVIAFSHHNAIPGHRYPYLPTYMLSTFPFSSRAASARYNNVLVIAEPCLLPVWSSCKRGNFAAVLEIPGCDKMPTCQADGAMPVAGLSREDEFKSTSSLRFCLSQRAWLSCCSFRQLRRGGSYFVACPEM